jgi:DNA polymerase elongation subunit (family B)
LEVIRRDESVFTKELLTELFEIILRQKNVDLTKWLIQKIKEFKQSPIEKIVIPQSFSKPLHQYKNKDAAVRGAIYASLHLDCNTDMSKVYMLYVKRIPGKPKTDVIAVDDTNKIPKDIIIDWQRMIERSIVGKVEDIFRNLGIPIIYHPQQTTLF